MPDTTEILNLISRFVFIGFILGFLYDIGRIIKYSFNLKKVFSFFHDFVFTFISGIVIFAFSVEPGDGGVRFFYIISALVGFTLYILSLGFVTKLMAKTLYKLNKRIYIAIRKAFCTLIDIISKTIYPKFYTFFVKIRQKKSELSEKCKIHLKKSIDMVYNNDKSKIGKLSENGGENRNVVKAKVKKSS